MKKLDDLLKELSEDLAIATQSIEELSGNPTEGFVRALLYLYRNPKETDAAEMARTLNKTFGKKEVGQLLAKAKDVLEMLSRRTQK